MLQNATAQAALQAAQAVIHARGGNSGAFLETNECNQTVLRVIVDNILYPITLDVLHSVRIPSLTQGMFIDISV